MEKDIRCIGWMSRGAATVLVAGDGRVTALTMTSVKTERLDRELGEGASTDRVTRVRALRAAATAGSRPSTTGCIAT